MANLIDLLQGQLSEGMIDQLSQQLGGADKQQTATAASGVINTIIGALNKNASSPEGASALAMALDRDHDGSILDDIMGMVTGAKQPQNTRMTNGEGIIKHVLGGNTSNVTDMISKLSGLDSNKSGSLLTMLAPVIMGALGRQKKESNLDESGLSGLLNKSVKSQSSKSAQMGLIERFLDQDGDGSVMDDIANIGLKTLGSLFNRK